jgi:polysaccharide pyruvyl transferase WcaK-like protein
LSRAIVLRALQLADYRSYRDLGSRDLLRAPALTRADSIVPDLAYALPIRVVAPPSGDRLVVGVSPMHFARPGSWPRADKARYRAHIEAFGDLAARLLEAGHEVIIFSTSAEEKALEDTYDIAARVVAGGSGRLSVAPTPTLDALFGVLARVDAVVASRLHGVLLAHVAHRPVLAVAHERKVRTLMEDMGQARYCVDLDRFDPADGMVRVRALLAERATLGAEIASRVAAYRQRVLAQYDLLFGPAGSDAPAEAPSP